MEQVQFILASAPPGYREITYEDITDTVYDYFNRRLTFKHEGKQVSIMIGANDRVIWTRDA
jgi:hypothetical protein